MPVIGLFVLSQLMVETFELSPDSRMVNDVINPIHIIKIVVKKGFTLTSSR